MVTHSKKSQDNKYSHTWWQI